MPMSFPRHEDVVQIAEIHGFRKPNEGENEMVYRRKVHEHVKPKDYVESYEILFGIGWDEWTDAQKHQSMRL